MKDYYAILHVRENAGAAEIKRAYRLLAVKYHPDKNPSHEAEELFKEINEAYDVLSDANKKFFYDQRRYNHLHKVVVEEPVKTHRDPRYRQRRSGSPRRPEKSAQYLLMEKWNKYAQWINISGLIVVIIFSADFFLPKIVTEETISDVVTVRGKRNSFAWYRIKTESGKSLKMYNTIGNIGESFELESTMFYRIPMRAKSGNFEIRLGYIYSPLAILPLAMLMTSIFGIISRKNIVQAFNSGLATAILLIITLFLIF